MSARAGGDPPSPGVPAPSASPLPRDDEVWARISGDPRGDATRLDAEALALLLGGSGAPPDPLGAAARWMDLVEGDPDATLPAPRETDALAVGAVEPGLWWPAREVALLRLAVLRTREPAVADALDRRFAAAAEALVDAARIAGDPTGLERAARQAPLCAAGSRAELLLAERDQEAGRALDAARRLDRWLRLHPAEPRERRATVAVRLVDAYERLDDTEGMVRVARRSALGSAPYGAVPVLRGVEVVTVAEVVSAARNRVRQRLRATVPEGSPAPVLPAALLRLWTRSLVDPGLVLEAPPEPDGPPVAAAAVAGSALYLGEERRVRRLDLETGLERWRFPEGELDRDYAAAQRYRVHERPVRAVLPVGPLVLAVLGDAPATGMFEYRGLPVQLRRLGQEARTRLFALDAATGRPRWWTGGIEETHPVLGASDVGVVSPPLVAAGSVYVVLAARRGDVETWLACLDVASGRPRFVTSLGRGESAVAPATPEHERALTETQVRSLPRAERPTLRAGEACVVTGSGAIAGVGAEDGLLRWVRAVPAWRLRGSEPIEIPRERTHAAANAPLSALGAWFVAPEDAAVPCAIEAGTGRLRWVARPRPEPVLLEGVDDAPQAQHLLDLVPDGDGGLWLRMAGVPRELELRDALRGEVVEKASFSGWPRAADEEPSGFGRPWVEGGRAVIARRDALRAADLPAGPSPRAWRPVASARRLDREDPPTGDVLRAGDLWIVVGATALSVLAPEETARRASLAVPSDPADAAARACLAARRTGTPAALRAAVAAVRGIPEAASPAGALADLLADAVTAGLDGPERMLASKSPERIVELLDVLDALSPTRRVSLYLRAALALVREHRTVALVTVLDRLMAFGDAALVEPDAEAGVRVRGDLAALALLRRVADATPEGRLALLGREAPAEAALAEAAVRGEDAMREAIRRHDGTVAAWRGRLALLSRAIDAGRAADAAAVAADLRLSAPIGVDLGAPAARALRALEGEALAATGEPEAARLALEEADDEGDGFARTARGDLDAALRLRLRADFGGIPADDAPDVMLRLVPAGTMPTEAELGDVAALEPAGPGASPDATRVLVARGLELEVFDLRTGGSQPVASVDAGFLGATLLDRDPALPGPGVAVGHLVAGAAADRAGLRVGDWLVGYAGREVLDRRRLTRAIAETPPGALVDLEVRRDGRSLRLRLVGGRRTRADDAPMAPEHAHLRRDGRAVVPSRFGLRAIDLGTGVAEDLWRYAGAGEVRLASGFGDEVHVVASAGAPGTTTVVCVEADTGRERWHATFDGDVRRRPRVLGSALVVDALDPDRTLLLDRRTGGLRGSFLRVPSAPPPWAGEATLAAEPSAVAGGCLHLLRAGAGGALWFAGIDPVTAQIVWQRQPASAQASRLSPPLVAGGSVVACAVTDEEVLVFVPDLRGGLAVAEPLRLEATRLQTHRWGAIEGDTRLVAAGDFVHVLRVSKDRRASVGSIEIDRESLTVPERASLWHPPRESAMLPSSSSTADARSGWPTFLAARANLDGVWATLLRRDSATPPHDGRALWFEPQRHDESTALRITCSIAYAQPPVRVGRHWLVRTDEGFLLLRFQPPPPGG